MLILPMFLEKKKQIKKRKRYKKIVLELTITPYLYANDPLLLQEGSRQMNLPSASF